MSENIAADELRAHVEAVERLESEKAGIAEDIKERYSLAKATGFDTKTIKKIVALRKMESHDRQESDLLLATYMSALGMQHSFDL